MKALREDMLKVNSFRERLYDNPVGHLWMTEDGGRFYSAPQPSRTQVTLRIAEPAVVRHEHRLDRS